MRACIKIGSREEHKIPFCCTAEEIFWTEDLHVSFIFLYRVHSLVATLELSHAFYPTQLLPGPLHQWMAGQQRTETIAVQI